MNYYVCVREDGSATVWNRDSCHYCYPQTHVQASKFLSRVPWKSIEFLLIDQKVRGKLIKKK